MTGILIAITATCQLGGYQPAGTAGTATVRHCVVSLIDHVEVPATEAGMLTELLCKEGMVVKKREKLGMIDSRDAIVRRKAATAELDEAKKTIEKYLAEIGAAEKTAGVLEAEHLQNEEINRASRGEAISKFELRRSKLQAERAKIQAMGARIDWDVAQKAADVRQAQVDVVSNEIERRELDSPLDGEIVHVYKHVGEWVNPGDPVCRIVHLNRLRIEGFIDADQYAPEQIAGKPVTISVELTGNQTMQLPSNISFVSPLVEASGEYRIWAEVDNQRVGNFWRLRPGLNAKMTIQLNAQ